MTQKSWPWDTNPPTGGDGDGAAGLTEASAREFLALYFKVQDPTSEGVSVGVLDELEVSGTSSPLEVAAGSAVCYGLYISDDTEELEVSTPVAGTTGGRVVLRTSWAGQPTNEATTRLAVKVSSDGVASIPALTQSAGTVWEISLASFTITTGGVITVTDDRTFRKSTGMVDTAEIHDDAITTAKIDDAAVTAAKIASRTRKFFVPCTGGRNTTGTTDLNPQGTVEGFPAVILPNGAISIAMAMFEVPQDFASDLTIQAICTPLSGATGDAYLRHAAYYGNIGESFDTHGAEQAYAAVTMATTGTFYSRAAYALAAEAAGDIVTAWLQRDDVNFPSSDTLSGDLYVMGFEVSYTADS